MRKKSWLFLMPMIAGLLWVGAAPGQAAGEDWQVDGIIDFGCTSGDWDLDVTFAGLDGGGNYIAHTVVTVGSLIYTNEDAGSPSNGTTDWGLFDNTTYGAVPNKGTWPMPAGHQMTATFTLERPKGTVLSSWTLVASSCDSKVLRYSGPTSSDIDGDLVPTAQDACPTLKAFSENGCPLRARSLSLTAPSKGPNRVKGRLSAAGYPALYAGQTVSIWKVRAGADKLAGTRTTTSLGKFKLKVGKGRYYATAPGLVAATSGEAAATSSPTVRVH
jgi:hypothetical protein